MTQESEKATTALISADICRAAKVYGAQHGMTIRTVIEKSVIEWLGNHGAPVERSA